MTISLSQISADNFGIGADFGRGALGNFSPEIKDD